MKFLVFLAFAILELSEAIPAENVLGDVSQVSQLKKVFPESAQIREMQTVSSKIVKHHKIKSTAANKKPYFFLSDYLGNQVIILDATSYEEVTSYILGEIALSILAIVDDSFYVINLSFGKILSTAVGNIMEGPESINWTHVGSFPSESNYIQSSSAVDGSLIYFLTHYGNLYSYDTKSRLVAKLGNAGRAFYYASLIVVNKIIYILRFGEFLSFDGATISSITTPEERMDGGLFRMGNNVCIFGGNNTDTYPDPVFCYNPQIKEWSTPNYINEARWYLGVAATELRTYIFGGWAQFGSGNNTPFWRDSIEVLNHETNIWSFAPNPYSIAEGPEYIQALAFYF